jgi:nicotinamide mononucleotide transporter PnuC
VFVVAMMGAFSAITSAEGWYSTNIIFILYAIGAAILAWQDKLYGDFLAMIISSAGSFIALFTWRKNLRKHVVHTRTLSGCQWTGIIICSIIMCISNTILLFYAKSEWIALNAIALTAIIVAEIFFSMRYCETYTMEIIGDLALMLIWICNHNWLLATTCALDATFAIYGLYNWRKLAVRKDKT